MRQGRKRGAFRISAPPRTPVRRRAGNTAPVLHRSECLSGARASCPRTRRKARHARAPDDGARLRRERGRDALAPEAPARVKNWQKTNALRDLFHGREGVPFSGVHRRTPFNRLDQVQLPRPAHRPPAKRTRRCRSLPATRLVRKEPLRAGRGTAGGKCMAERPPLV